MKNFLVQSSSGILFVLTFIILCAISVGIGLRIHSATQIPESISTSTPAPKTGSEPVPDGTNFQGRDDNATGNPSEKAKPNVVFPIRAEEDADILYRVDDSGGHVTLEELEYLKFLFIENRDAFEDLFENRYPGTISQALAEKYGLPAGTIIPDDGSQWIRDRRNGIITAPDAYPGVRDVVN